MFKMPEFVEGEFYYLSLNWLPISTSQQLQLEEREQREEPLKDDEEAGGKLKLTDMRDLNSKISEQFRGVKRIKIDLADKASLPRLPSTLKIVLTTLQPPTDFFGRPIVRPQAPAAVEPKRSEAKPDPLTKTYKIAYRFKEGNLAAVRHPIKISALL